MRETISELRDKAAGCRNTAAICAGASSLNALIALNASTEVSPYLNGGMACVVGALAIKSVLNSISFDGQANALEIAQGNSLPEAAPAAQN